MDIYVSSNMLLPAYLNINYRLLLHQCLPVSFPVTTAQSSNNSHTKMPREELVLQAVK